MSETQIGRTPEVSDETIIRAGNALLQQERRVTGFALRKAVGNKGDAGRLLRVWQVHLNAQDREQGADGSDLPSELSEALSSVNQKLTHELQSIVQRLNGIAIQTAESRVASAVNQANERERVAEAEVRDAMKRIDELEAQLASLSQAHTEFVDKLQQREQENQKVAEQLESSVNALNDTLRQLHETQRQHDLLTQQNDALETGLNNVQKQYSDLKADFAAKEKELEMLTIQLEVVSEEKARLLDDLVNLAAAS
ncbi:DNA-binding protein [uncultured Photobacterium sp.]|uniref:DNA-binding protein n=1 Tax=uncultured Photobacterium sp. TaxID=173973 RepID=UPI00261C0065|nr:DNA-binding protein [uncultured Photobacterium sp.]